MRSDIIKSSAIIKKRARQGKKKEQAFFILWLYLLGFGTSNKDRVLKIEIYLNNRDVRFSSLT